MKLGSRFASPEEACCGLSSVDENAPCVTTEPPEHLAYSPVSIQHITPSLPSSASITAEDSLMDRFRLLSPEDQTTFLGETVSLVASEQFQIELPKQFIQLALCGMQNLEAAKRSNVIYGLCKGLAKFRENNPSETLFPTSRMPMGLLEFMVEFFAGDFAHNVSYNA